MARSAAVTWSRGHLSSYLKQQAVQVAVSSRQRDPDALRNVSFVSILYFKSVHYTAASER